MALIANKLKFNTE